MQLLNHQSVLAYSSVQWLDSILRSSTFHWPRVTSKTCATPQRDGQWTLVNIASIVSWIVVPPDTKLLIKKAMNLPPRRKYQPQHSQGCTRNISWNFLLPRLLSYIPCITLDALVLKTQRHSQQCPNSQSTNVPFLISPLQHTPS